MAQPPSALPTGRLGSTGREVTVLGLGGEGILRTWGEEAGAAAVIAAAVRHGISYFDSARAYAGSESYYGAFWARHPEARARVFVTSKSPARDAAGARRDLDTSLETLHTDHLDLWQLHDMRSERDLAAISRRGGALDAFLEAKAAGRVRHIGVTGHESPEILLRAIRELPLDTVLLPVNVVEGVLGGFLDEVLPEAKRRGLGTIGMKVFGGRYFLSPALELSPRDLLRYARAQGSDLLIVGCATPDEVAANVAAAAEAPLTAEEQHALLEQVRPFADRLAYYRS